MYKYIQFTFAFGLVAALLTRVVHPLKEQGPSKDKRSRVDWCQCSLRGRENISLTLVEISKTSGKRQDFSNPAAVKLPIVKTVDSIQIVKFTSVNLKTIELTNFVNNMFDTTTDSCGSQQQLFTTRYSYGGRDQEYVFCCRGRPFAALVSQNLPTPTSSLIDFDLVKTLGLKVTDLQCKKFFFAGYKMRILGRVSTTVQ